MAGRGERLGRLYKKCEIHVYCLWVFWGLFVYFVFNIWMPSCFSNTFNTILGLLKYLKEFVKQQWILSQRIAYMVYQWIVHAIYAVMFYVLQEYSIFNALSMSQHCETEKPAVEFQGCLLLRAQIPSFLRLALIWMGNAASAALLSPWDGWLAHFFSSLLKGGPVPCTPILIIHLLM